MDLLKLQLVAQHAHQLCEIAKLEDLEETAKRLDGGERNQLIETDEQAQQMAELARATATYVRACNKALGRE